MRIGRSRKERRNNRPKYMDEIQLRIELEDEATKKRMLKKIKQLEEKKELLAHYQNYKMGNMKK